MTEESEIIKKTEKACAFCEKEFTYEEVRAVLEGDNDVEKRLCLLKFDELRGQKDVDLLLFHLTEHHGSVRESAAMKINEHILNGKYVVEMSQESLAPTFLAAINDVNPNICRLIIETLPYIINKECFLNLLYPRFEAVFEELEKLKRSNWYTKKLFNLYWCREALAVLDAPVDDRLEKVLGRTCLFRDYTIREKTAQVLSVLTSTSNPLEAIKSTLRDDTNFYVKRYVNMF